MSVKIKGNQWCERCGKATTAVKSTHRLRSIAGAALIPVTVGLSGFAVKHDPYVCAACGGAVRAIPTPPSVRTRRRAANDKANLFAGRIMATFAVLLAALLVLGALLAVADTIFG